MDPLDDIVRDAMKALEAKSTPRDYFDQLPDRIHVRLEGSMQTEPEITRSPDGSHNDAGGVPRQEDSGLHDIKALAQTTKTRISRRQTSQHDLDQTLIASTQSGLHAVALPDPAKMVQLPTVEEARALARSTSGMAAVATELEDAPRAATPAREPVARSKGVPVWMWAGGGLAAAAAAVMAFVVLGGKDTASEQAAKEAAGPVSNLQQDKAAAAGAPTAEPLREQPPPAAAAVPADEGITTGGIAPDPAPAPAEAEAPVVDESSRVDRKKKEREADRASDKKDEKVKADVKKDDAIVPKDAIKKDDKKKEETKAPPPDKKLEGAVLGSGDSDELGIGDALGGGDKKKDEAPKKTELSNQEVRDGLDAINGKAKACYGAHGQTGTVKVKLTIAPSGKVSKASASGDLAGTPAGDCVVSAVKSAEFPPWEGAPKSTSYVVLLSD